MYFQTHVPHFFCGWSGRAGVGQGPTVLTVGAARGCSAMFSRLSFFTPYLWETARYRLKCCFKGSLNPQTNTKFTFSQALCIFHNVCILTKILSSNVNVERVFVMICLKTPLSLFLSPSLMGG